MPNAFLFFKARIKCKDMNTCMCICAYNLHNINYNDTKIVPVLSVCYTISTSLGMLILAHFTLYQYFDIRGLSRRYPAMYYEKQRHLLKQIQDIRNIVLRT